MKIKKLDQLFGECDNKAYQCQISFDQNRGIQVQIKTKYTTRTDSTSGYKESFILYKTDWEENAKDAIKNALHWINEVDDFREKEEQRLNRD